MLSGSQGKNSHYYIFSLFAGFLIVFLCSCTDEKLQLFGRCITCHEQTHTDQAHQFPCTNCHNGDSTQALREQAHKNLIAQPAHPDNMADKCAACHSDKVKAVSSSLHLTLKNEINLVRQSYGATNELDTLTEIPVHEFPENSLQLVDDMLRRRCLLCHLYYKGESYSATIHGTGCAACHLSFENQKLGDHAFLSKPADKQCLSCHYGNYIGADYYGRYEHDLNVEYRTPYYTNIDNRPYGVEYHQLSADIHQQKGISCIDCHSGAQLMNMGNSSIITCSSCHERKELETHLPPGVSTEADRFILTAQHTGTKHPIPLMKHRAHQLNDRVACQVCHAQWSFNDGTTHLLRSDLDEYDQWDRLTVQGSSEVEYLLVNNLDFSKEEIPPVMSDKITGDIMTGVWYKSFLERRWEEVLIGRDKSNKLTVVRPILDYTLTWIDEDETIRYDSLTTPALNNGMRPYVPHTTGPAGLFYEQRVRQYLNNTDASIQN